RESARLVHCAADRTLRPADAPRIVLRRTIGPRDDDAVAGRGERGRAGLTEARDTREIAFGVEYRIARRDADEDGVVASERERDARARRKRNDAQRFDGRITVEREELGEAVLAVRRPDDLVVGDADIDGVRRRNEATRGEPIALLVRVRDDDDLAAGEERN